MLISASMYIIWRQKYIYILCKRCYSSANLYEKLGVSPNATQAEIKEAYIKLSKLYHPDTRTAHSSSEKFAEINAAYETLGRTDRRRLYDSERLWRSASAGASYPGATAAASSPGAGRRSAGPDDFEQRMRHDMEWMYRAAAAHQRRQGGADSGDSQSSEVELQFKAKIILALTAVIVVGIGVRLFVMSIIQASQQRREKSDFELAMSLLNQSEAHSEERLALINHRRKALDRQGASQQQQRRQERQQRQAAAKTWDDQLDSDYLAQFRGYNRPRTVAPSHARNMQDRRLKNFRRTAASWSAETRAALRPRLSAELAQELDKLEAEERAAAVSGAAG